jgi:hypothetical protein
VSTGLELLNNIGTVKTVRTLGDWKYLHNKMDRSLLEASGRMLWFNEMYLDVNLTRSGLVMVNLDYQLD